MIGVFNSDFFNNNNYCVFPMIFTLKYNCNNIIIKYKICSFQSIVGNYREVWLVNLDWLAWLAGYWIYLLNINCIIVIIIWGFFARSFRSVVLHRYFVICFVCIFVIVVVSVLWICIICESEILVYSMSKVIVM